MRLRLPAVAGLVLVAVVAALIALGPASGSAGAVRLTFIGDSKAAAIEFSTKAKRLLARGHHVRRDLKVCRRLVAPSCPYNGVTPRTALGAVRHYGTSLGRVLVIDVGYNDSASTYRLGRVMRAALSRGVKGVVWVNLKAVRSGYRAINRKIRRGRERFARLYLANWNRYSRGHPGWFSQTHDDGIHLTGAGAVGLVKLVRRYIPLAADGPRSTTGSHIALDFTTTNETESAAAEATVNSAPVASNLDAGGSTGLSGILPFAGGAALMLFLVFVTVKRRGSA